ncbi:MAG: hypothetical protein OXQ27_01180 [Chloroflexota bacterium]|nr:hypothetical protein [Chloroflexota bacterium]
MAFSFQAFSANPFIRRHGPWLGAALVLTAVVTAFFWKALLTDRVLAGYDLSTYFYPYRQYAAMALRQANLPLWNPYLFQGVPFLANQQTAVLYPPNLLYLLFSAETGLALSIALHLIWGALGVYVYTRRVTALIWPAAMGAAITFGLSGFLGAQVGHVNQVNAAVWLPWALFVTHHIYHGRSVRWAVALSCLLALQFLAGHAQPSYMTLVAIMLYWLGHAVWDWLGYKGYRPAFFAVAGDPATQPRAIRPEPSSAPAWFAYLRDWYTRSLWRPVVALFLLGGAFAGTVALAAPQLLPMLQLTHHSIRQGGLSYAEATAFSLSPREFLAGMLPTPDGFVSTDEFFGFVGILAICLAVLAVAATIRRPATSGFAFLALAGLLLALGAYIPAYQALFAILPGLDLFRVPARWLLLYTFAASVLVGIGIDWIATTSRDHGRLRATLLRFGSGVILLAIVIAALTPFQHSLSPELPLIWLGLTVASVGLILLAIRVPSLALLLPLFLGLELFWASRHLEYNQAPPPIAYSEPGPVTATLRDLYQGGRILSLAGTAYAPGVEPQLREQFAHLGDGSTYNLLVTQKYFEVMTPNIPQGFQIATVDGYDGGVLPLDGFVRMKEVLQPGASAQPDAILRDQLRAVPPPRILDLFGVAYLLDDKIRDPWVDDVYYDTTFTQAISAESPTVAIPNVPDIAADHIGIISYLTDAATLPQGQPIATIRITTTDNRMIERPIHVGVHTAEGEYEKSTPAHQAVRVVGSWPDNPQGRHYHAVIDLGETVSLKEVVVEYQATGGTLHMVAMSAIGPETHAPLILTTEPMTLLFSGDVKLYQRERALGLLYAVGTVYLAESTDLARLALSSSAFRVGQDVILEREADFLELPPRNALTGFARPLKHRLQRMDLWGGGPPLGVVPPHQEARFGESTASSELNMPRYALADDAQAVSLETERPQPEHLIVRLESPTPHVLIFAETFIPGWEATLDGEPTEIWRANAYYQAVWVPAGTHEIVFRYQPVAFRFGVVIALIALPALGFLWFLPALIRRLGWV